MLTTGNRGGTGRSEFVVAIKVLVVWFFLARALLVIGISNGIPDTTVWALDILFFVLTALYVFVRESVSQGLSVRMFVFAVMLGAGGVGIFSSLPRNLHLKEMAKQQFPLIGSLHTLMGDDDEKALIDMRPFEHLAKASKLIFANATSESLTQARRHLRRIPTTAVEFPSAQQLLKAADLRAKVIELRSAGAKDASGVKDASQQANAPATVEIVEVERNSKGWRVTVRNTTSTSVGHLQYEVTCFNSGGWQINLDHQLPVSENVIRPDQSMTFNIGPDMVPRDAAYVSVQIVSWKEGSKGR
jgi:hypothetical protein